MGATCPRCSRLLPPADYRGSRYDERTRRLEQGYGICRACQVFAPIESFVGGEELHSSYNQLPAPKSKAPLGVETESKEDSFRLVTFERDDLLIKCVVTPFAAIPCTMLLAVVIMKLVRPTGNDGAPPVFTSTELLAILIVAGIISFGTAIFLLVKFGAKPTPTIIEWKDDLGSITVGHGRSAKRQPFQPSSVYNVAQAVSVSHGEDSTHYWWQIRLDTYNGPVEFGTALATHKLEWIVRELRQHLISDQRSHQRCVPPRPHCPRCRGEIALDSINPAEEVAKCDACSRILKTDQLDITGITERAASIDEPLRPRRCAFESTASGFLASARQGGRAVAVPLIAAIVFYALSMPFALTGGAGLCVHLGLLSDHWLPMMGDGDTPKTPMTTSEAIMFLVGAAFAASLASWALFHAILAKFGSTTASVNAGTLKLRHGIGNFAKTTELSVSSIRSARVTLHKPGSAETETSICIDTVRETVRFGKHLERDQQEWLATHIARLLPTPRHDQRRMPSL